MDRQSMRHDLDQALDDAKRAMFVRLQKVAIMQWYESSCKSTGIVAANFAIWHELLWQIPTRNRLLNALSEDLRRPF